MTPTEPATTAITSMPSTAAQASLYQQLRGQQEFDDYTRYLKEHAKIK